MIAICVLLTLIIATTATEQQQPSCYPLCSLPAKTDLAQAALVDSYVKNANLLVSNTNPDIVRTGRAPHCMLVRSEELREKARALSDVACSHYYSVFPIDRFVINFLTDSNKCAVAARDAVDANVNCEKQLKLNQTSPAISQ